MTAYKCHNGEVVFQENRGDVAHVLHLPCGKCDGCRLERSRQWAIRCMHEAHLYERNCFITLTYNDEHMPKYGHLKYSDFQKFMKRFRKAFPKQKIRFFMCGEYGGKGERPHYHACIFNFDFDDRVYYKTTASLEKIYQSATLDRLWSDRSGNPIGFCTVGNVTFKSAGYVARYVLKKRTGREPYEYNVCDDETGEAIKKPDEFVHMSLRDGIGKGFYEKYFNDIFPNDYCVVNGKKMKPPRYYAKRLAEDNPELYNDIQFERHIKALTQSGDNTPDRLEVKEKVLQAQIKFLKRELT